MFYFSYGSNMNQENMNRFCEKIGRPIIDLKTRNPRVGLLKDFKLDFNVYSSEFKLGGGAGNIENSPGDHVEGTVFDMLEDDMITLDAKESAPSRYIRITVPITLRDGTELKDVVTYTAVEAIKGKFCAPSQAYKRDIIDGARVCGLSDDWIKKLEKLPTQAE